MPSATPLKAGELDNFRKVLLHLRSRLQGDLDQMTDEALSRSQADSSGNLSNLPIHLADIGSELYEQEFTLGLIENEQVQLDEVQDALARLNQGIFGLCESCQKPIAKARLQALPYTRHCIECARKLESTFGVEGE